MAPPLTIRRRDTKPTLELAEEHLPSPTTEPIRESDFHHGLLGVTAEDGLAAIATLGIKKGKASYQFCVDDAIDSAFVLIYDPSANVETCDSF